MEKKWWRKHWSWQIWMGQNKKNRNNWNIWSKMEYR